MSVSGYVATAALMPLWFLAERGDTHRRPTLEDAEMQQQTADGTRAIRQDHSERPASLPERAGEDQESEMQARTRRLIVRVAEALRTVPR